MEKCVGVFCGLLLTIFFTAATEAAGCRTGPTCVADCAGVADGDYQSCDRCGLYVTCSESKLYSDRPCPPSHTPLVWNDELKRCDYSTSTCIECDECVTGPTCVADCYQVPDGDYQSCKDCHTYLSCVGGYMFSERPCPAQLIWHDGLKRCDWVSPSCTPCL